MNKFIFLQLNEINFDILKKYLEDDKNHLKNFDKIQSSFKFCETFAEKEYNQLEPWIQWVSVFTGKKYSEHKIFRLGDIVLNNNLKQIFENIRGRRVESWCNRTNECRKSTKETIIFHS